MIKPRFNPDTQTYYFAKFDIVHSLVGGGAITLTGDDFIFHDGQTPPTEEEISAEMARTQAEWDNLQYQRNRVSGVSGSYAVSQGTGSIYPSTGEQFDMLYHELETSGSLTTSGSWFKVITSVKDANPKPE